MITGGRPAKGGSSAAEGLAQGGAIICRPAGPAYEGAVGPEPASTSAECEMSSYASRVLWRTREIQRPMSHRGVVAACLAVALLLSGCSAGWSRIPVEDRLAVPRQQQVQVWRGGQVLHLQGLIVVGDSVRGIPFPRPPGCDTCRVALARAEVDSVRVGDPVGALWQSALIAGGVLGGVYVIMCVRTNLCGWYD